MLSAQVTIDSEWSKQIGVYHLRFRSLEVCSFRDRSRLTLLPCPPRVKCSRVIQTGKNHHGCFSFWALSTDILANICGFVEQSSIHLLWFLLGKLTLCFENNSSELDVYMCLKAPLPLIWKRISPFSYNSNNSWKQGCFGEILWWVGGLEFPASGTDLGPVVAAVDQKLGPKQLRLPEPSGEAGFSSHLPYFSHNSNVLNYLVNCLEGLLKSTSLGKREWTEGPAWGEPAHKWSRPEQRVIRLVSVVMMVLESPGKATSMGSLHCLRRQVAILREE